MPSSARLPLLLLAFAVLAVFQVAVSNSRARAARHTPAPKQATHREAVPPQSTGEPAQTARRVDGFRIVHVRQGKKLQLRARPRGRVVATVGPRTRFGSKTVLS